MKAFFTLAVMFLTLQCFALGTHQIKQLPEFEGSEILGELPADAVNSTINDFLDLTPKKYREMTGKKLGFANTFKLKAAQKVLKKRMNEDAGVDIPKGLYIVGALFGWSWLIMGLMDEFKGNNWWVNLLLLFLCFLPGVIHAFVKMKDYY